MCFPLHHRTHPTVTSSQKSLLRRDYHSSVYIEQVCFTKANATSNLYFMVVTQTHPFLRADHAKNFLAEFFNQAPISSSLSQLAHLLLGCDYMKSKLLVGNFSTYLKITFLRGNGASEKFRLNLGRHFLLEALFNLCRGISLKKKKLKNWDT